MSTTSITTDEEDVMAMHNPPHPGGIVGRQCVEPLGLSTTGAAEHLGVTRQSLSELVNERSGVSVGHGDPGTCAHGAKRPVRGCRASAA